MVRIYAVKEMSGLRFGALLVLEIDETRCKTSSAYWKCLCDCGVTKSFRGDVLRKNKTLNCGCISPNMRHGKSKSAIYLVWKNMIRRCTEPSNPAFSNYGGRGISVCRRWLIFENFYADMGDPPDGMSLDRYPDVNGGYAPENCRWATVKQQQNNRRTNRRIKIGGAEKTLAEWCQEYGQPYGRVLARIDRYGWSPEAALSTGKKSTGRRNAWSIQ